MIITEFGLGFSVALGAPDLVNWYAWIAVCATVIFEIYQQLFFFISLGPRRHSIAVVMSCLHGMLLVIVACLLMITVLVDRNGGLIRYAFVLEFLLRVVELICICYLLYWFHKAAIGVEQTASKSDMQTNYDVAGELFQKRTMRAKHDRRAKLTRRRIDGIRKQQQKHVPKRVVKRIDRPRPYRPKSPAEDAELSDSADGNFRTEDYVRRAIERDARSRPKYKQPRRQASKKHAKPQQLRPIAKNDDLATEDTSAYFSRHLL